MSVNSLPPWSPDASRLVFMDKRGLRAFVVKENRFETLVPSDRPGMPRVQTVTCLTNGDVFFVRNYDSVWQYRASDGKLRRLLNEKRLRKYISR